MGVAGPERHDSHAFGPGPGVAPFGPGQHQVDPQASPGQPAGKVRDHPLDPTMAGKREEQGDVRSVHGRVPSLP